MPKQTLEEMLQDPLTTRESLIAIARELRWQRDELINAKHVTADAARAEIEAAEAKAATAGAGV